MSIKLFVSDLDGTLLNHYRRIDPETVRAIRDLQSSGVICTLATGRLDLATRFFARQLGIDAPIISCNGAITRNLDTGTLISQNFLNQQVSWDFLSWLGELQADFLVYDSDQIYYPYYSRRVKFFNFYNRQCQLADVPGVPIRPFSDVKEIFAPDNAFLKFFSIIS